MTEMRPGAAAHPPALLVVSSPSGHRSETPLHPLPFHIGRLAQNHLVLRDNRISRRHARIIAEEGAYVIEDLGSRYGVFVNGARAQRHRLRPGDRISFGFEDSYQLVFLLRGADVEVMPARPEATALARLRATLEVARALQASLSTDEVLAAVVEAALAITGGRRGFLLLLSRGELQVRVARDRTGPLSDAQPAVSPAQLRQALTERTDLFSIRREAVGGGIAIPLVRIRTGAAQQTSVLSPLEDTVGLLYVETDDGAELPAGGQELLTTLALEASTVLENARLLEQQWARQRMENELRIARGIQESLLPRALPSSSWLRAAAASVPSREVGGDYYDLRPISDDCWALAVADVSGKGVGAALLAALLQGMFVAAPYTRLPIEEMMGRVNRFLLERTGGEQYATLVYGLLECSGRMRLVNAGHPPVLLLRRGEVHRLVARSVPIGLLEEAAYVADDLQLEVGDRLVIYTDGLTEARNASGESFGLGRLERLLQSHGRPGAESLHRRVLQAVQEFIGDAQQPDDIALLVLEFGPPAETA